MKRNHEIKVRFNDDEYNNLIVKVNKSGLSREKFIRNLIQKTTFKKPPPIEYFQLVNECNAIGNNLNQLIKLAYIHQETNPQEISSLFEKLTRLLQAM